MAEGYRSEAASSAMDKAVSKGILEPRIVDAKVTILVDTVSFTIPVANFVKHKVEKSFLDKKRMKKRFFELVEEVEQKK